MPDIVMPRLSDSMTEGTIVRWLKADGDEVQRGEEIVEVETDKATVGYEAEVSGTLAIREPEGAVVAVGMVIAEIGAAHPAPVRVKGVPAGPAPGPRARSGALGARRLGAPRPHHQERRHGGGGQRGRRRWGA